MTSYKNYLKRFGKIDLQSRRLFSAASVHAGIKQILEAVKHCLDTDAASLGIKELWCQTFKVSLLNSLNTYNVRRCDRVPYIRVSKYILTPNYTI